MTGRSRRPRRTVALCGGRLGARPRWIARHGRVPAHPIDRKVRPCSPRYSRPCCCSSSSAPRYCGSSEPLERRSSPSPRRGLVVATGGTAHRWTTRGRRSERLGPVIGFLAAVLVLAKLCDDEGVFRACGATGWRGVRPRQPEEAAHPSSSWPRPPSPRR
ncbi:hypothetical protein ACU686_05800 [Yinghuangia aomiensis]